MKPGRLNLQGAVDLGALAARSRAGAEAASPAAANSSFVVEVTEGTFQEQVLDRSQQVPVVVDLWATWCGPCKQLSPVLIRLAEAYQGRFILATIDVDANPRLAQMFQVQSIPSVVAVVAGQAVPLFMGALPEPQVRQYLDQLLTLAAQQGLTGGADPLSDTEPPLDPRHDAAADAIEANDLERAETLYRELIAGDPTDALARAALGQVVLLRRAAGVDPDAAMAAAAASPTDVALATRAADALVLVGRSAEAFSVLVGTVRATSGAERQQVRDHLVELFDLVGPDDPAVAPARTALANALF